MRRRAFFLGLVRGREHQDHQRHDADQSFETREAQFAIAAEEARQAQDLAEREYSRGVATLFELIDAYTRRIDAERGFITARAARVSNRIAYHVALGGGARTGGIDEDREVTP